MQGADTGARSLGGPGAAAGSASASAAPHSEGVVGAHPDEGDDATYDIQQVLAIKRDPLGKVPTRYWVRWLGYGNDQDSWIPSKLAGKGESEAQLELWIRQNQPFAPPVELLGPMRVSSKQAMASIPVREDDWAQLDAALAARDRGVVPRGRAIGTT